MKSYIPQYIYAYNSGILKHRSDLFKHKMKSCDLCPHKCMINRNSCDEGICKTGKYAFVASYGPHFGEEAALVGKRGSGTIFFSGCNLLCNFCQNYEISRKLVGTLTNRNELAEIMFSLQSYGCKNINFVTPTHVIAQIIEALISVTEKGLNIPLIYNTSSYDSVETIKLLNGIIDIYMPDFKFWDNCVSELTCNVDNYMEIAKESIKEMHNQRGVLEFDSKGNAVSGLLIRHLVMPDNLSGTKEVLNFIAEDISKDTYVNIMPQYRPPPNILIDNKLSRSITASEYNSALSYAESIGLKNLV